MGLGTCHMHDHETLKRAVSEAGYRMYDCASYYKNEEVVGKAIRELLAEKVITREELFVVSKVWVDEMDDVEAACKRSLLNLGIEYVDCYLVHWPVSVRKIEGSEAYERTNIPMHKIWADMEALVDIGLARSIGVSNFNAQLLWDVLSYARHKPVVN